MAMATILQGLEDEFARSSTSPSSGKMRSVHQLMDNTMDNTIIIWGN